MKNKKPKICLYDIEFNGKYLSFDEALQVINIAYGYPFDKIGRMKITSIKKLMEKVEKRLTARQMILIHDLLQRQDEKARRGFFGRLFYGIIGK